MPRASVVLPPAAWRLPARAVSKCCAGVGAQNDQSPSSVNCVRVSPQAASCSAFGSSVHLPLPPSPFSPGNMRAPPPAVLSYCGWLRLWKGPCAWRIARSPSPLLLACAVSSPHLMLHPEQFSTNPSNPGRGSWKRRARSPSAMALAAVPPISGSRHQSAQG